MVLSDCYSWDNEQSGHARPGGPRRTRRLVSPASSLAQHTGLSIVKSSQSTAQVEGAYRLIRNPSVSPQAIAEAGFTATVRACEAHPLLLALEDTTTINFSHSTASDDLGNTTTNPKTRGLLAHSVLMYAPDRPCQSVLSNSSAGVGSRTPTVLSTSEKNVPVKKKKVTAGSRLRSVWPNGWGRYRNG